MKNLKKVLSLVLALAMALSLMTAAFAADASDYKDYSKVTYKEAVDVMTAAGIFNGGDGNNFNPDATLNREQAAKIITYMLVGQAQADKLTTTIAPYSDVAATRWSAGSIAYCTNEGIIAGDGNGRFNPTDGVTGLQFAKMLLVALGYDPKIEGLVGNSWAINTSKLALSDDANLGDKLESVTLSQPLTREQAAQMALNAFKAPLVEYENKGGDIVIGDVPININPSKYNFVTTTLAKTQTISSQKLSNSNAYTVEFAERYCQDLKLVAGSTDAFERPASTWKYKNAEIGTYADEADLTYTDETKIGTIYTDLGLSDGIDNADVTLYVDGRLTAFPNDIVKGSRVEVGGEGVLLDVYYDDEADTLTLVEVNTYVGQVAAVRAASTTTDAYVVLDVSDTFTNPGVNVGNYETTDFAKDDIVAYTYSFKSGEKCIESMALAEKVTGTMSTYTTTGSVTVNGTKYEANKKSAANIAGFASTVDKSKDVDVYLDAYGYGLYVDADTSVEYAVILAYEKGNTLDNGRAKLLFTDGTAKVVNIDKIGTVADNFDSLTGDQISKWDIVSYSVNSDDEYNIQLAADANAGNQGGAFELKSGSNTYSIVSGNKANISSANKVTHFADGETILLVADNSDPDKMTFSAYEGISAWPTIKHNGGNAGAVTVFMDSTSSGDPATVIFVEKNAKMSMSSDNKDVIYVKGSNVGKSYTTALGEYYEYDAFVNGTETTIKTDTAHQFTNDALIYGPRYNEKEILTGYEDMVVLSTTAGNDGDLRNVVGTGAVKNEVVKLGGTPYAYTSDVQVYFVDVDGNLIASDIGAITDDADDLVAFKVNDDGRLTDVYVKIVDAAENVNPGAGSVRILNMVEDNGDFKVTVATTTTVTADKWTLSIYQNGVKVGETVNQPSGTFNANTGYGLTADNTYGVSISGTYTAVLTIYNGATVAATGTAEFTI